MWFVSRAGYYVVVLTRGWTGVRSGVLAARAMVCTVRAVVSRSVFCCVGIACVGSLVRRYALWYRVSWLYLHSVLNIAYL